MVRRAHVLFVKKILAPSKSPLLERCCNSLQSKRLFAQCTTCGKSVNCENSAVHTCEGAATAVAPQPRQPVVDPDPAQAMQQILEDAQAGKFSPEVEKICTAYVKTRLKESTDGKTVLFKTGGKVS